MSKTFLIGIFIMVSNFNIQAQSSQIELKGALRIEGNNSVDQYVDPEAGMIRNFGINFRGHNGRIWIPFGTQPYGYQGGQESAVISLEVEGIMKIGHLPPGLMPQPGTIRWSGYDFEGYNGEKWVSLTGGKTSPIDDIDNNPYTTKRIGDQIWMTDNLSVSHYRNGDPIDYVLEVEDWSNTIAGAYCWYSNDSVTNKAFGKLYNYYVIEDVRGLCPEGWKIPTLDDWTKLIEYLGGSNLAGEKLKHPTSWNTPSTSGIFSSGFKGYAGGERASAVGPGYFYGKGAKTHWWTSSETISGYPYILSLNDGHAATSVSSYNKNGGFYVRCILDQ